MSEYAVSRRSFLMTGAALGLGACASLPPTSAAGPWRHAQDISQSVTSPRFPVRRMAITDFGAVGDGATKNTEAFAKTIKSCANAGGGHVVVPAGRYLTGPIHLASNINLHVEEGAVILFSTDPADYPLAYTRYEGVELWNYSPLIYARGAQNVAVTGAGLLDGQASNDHWWPWCGAERFGWEEGMGSQSADRRALFHMAEEGVPVEDRVFGRGHYLRPSFIEF